MCSKAALAGTSEKEPHRIFVKDTLAHVPHLFLYGVIHNLYFPTRTGSTDHCVSAAQFIQVSRDIKVPFTDLVTFTQHCPSIAHSLVQTEPYTPRPAKSVA